MRLTSSQQAINLVKESFWRGLRPDPFITVAEWADQYRRLPKEAAAEYGPWRTSRTPYLKEIMECLSVTSTVEEVSFMKGAQLGGTEVGNNFLAYAIDLGLGPTLAVSKTDLLAKRFAKQRLRPMLRDTPRLRSKVSEPSKRDGSNTLLHISFDGGQLMLVNAEAAGGLRSMPIRNLFGDEVDSYPLDVEGEGDPCDLAEARTRTFSSRKVLWVSTPTDEATSRIAAKYRAGDMRKYFVPCPECDAYQVLEWKQLDYNTDEDGQLIGGSTRYACTECGCLIEEWQKTEMLARGEWRPTRAGASETVRSYHLSSLYSPVGWCSWEQIARAFVAAKGDPKKLKVFVNTMLGETWRERGETPDWEALFNRREEYPLGHVPKGVVFLTMGIDVQKDRLEYEVVGWGERHESWSIDSGVIECDPTQKEWHDDVDELRLKAWPGVDGGSFRIRRTAIDMGYQAHHIYSYCRSRQDCQAVQGQERFPDVVGPERRVDINLRGKRVRRGASVRYVGTNLCKEELYSFLGQKPPAEGPLPIGFCHFPQYPTDFFKQLTAEQLVIQKDRRGFIKKVWEKIRERNEALDCRIYARAAASIVGLDKWTPERWKVERANQGTKPKPAKAKKRKTMHGRNKAWLTR